MATDKRERQRSARLEKTVAEHTAARKARTRRTTLRVGVAAVLVLGVLFAVSQLMGNEDDSDTATSDATDTTAVTAPDDPDITALPEEFSNPELAAEVEGRGAPAPTPPAADTAPDALETTTLIEGEGDGAEADQILTVHYIGYLPDGTVFDQSWDRPQPFTFQLGVGKVIPGWDNGLEGAKIGERRHLVIGANNGYGASGSPPAIPPNSPLGFDVDIVDIQPGGAFGAPAGLTPRSAARSAWWPSRHTLTDPTPAARQLPSGSRIRAVRSSTSASATPAGVSWRVRWSLSSDQVSARGTMATWASRPRPSVNAPPRGSTGDRTAPWPRPPSRPAPCRPARPRPAPPTAGCA